MSGIPINLEHVEARAMEMKEERRKMKERMTPAEVARLEIIEECSAKLEAADIPYELWAASDETKPDNGGRDGWWCFHRLSYDPTSNVDVYTDRVLEAWTTLYPRILGHQSSRAAITIVMYNLKTGHPAMVFSRGEIQYIPPPPPDLPTETKP